MLIGHKPCLWFGACRANGMARFCQTRGHPTAERPPRGSPVPLVQSANFVIWMADPPFQGLGPGYSRSGVMEHASSLTLTLNHIDCRDSLCLSVALGR